MMVTPVLDHGFRFGQNAPGCVRGAGLHMSDCYGAMYKALDPKKYDREGEFNPLLLELGMAWEDRLERHVIDAFGNGTERPSEMVDPEYGIKYSPDMLIFNGHTRLGEIKLTWMSSREWPQHEGDGFPPQADKWLCQMRLYCYQLQTPYACLLALFVNGNYDRKKGPGPEFRMWNIEFSARELREEWQTVIGFSKSKGLIV